MYLVAVKTYIVEMKTETDNVKTLKELGLNLKEFRKAKGLSQEQLSELAGLHPTYISQLETGKANPSMVILIAVAEQLGITIVDLLRGSAISESDALILELKEILNTSGTTQKQAVTTILEGIVKAYKK